MLVACIRRSVLRHNNHDKFDPYEQATDSERMCVQQKSTQLYMFQPFLR